MSDRYSRQAEIVPADRLAGRRITIVGVGAVGRQLALQLAAMGATSLQLIDFDSVEESNVASQGYAEGDIGRLKAEATADACRRINLRIEIDGRCERFRRSMDVGDVVLAAVDSIEARRLIFRSVEDRASFYGDVRMTAETIRVLTACDAAGRGHYAETLFGAGEAHAGVCTSKMTIFAANIGAGLLLHQFSRWLRGHQTDHVVTLNLLASEMTVGEQV